jgi:hypothetical protein
MAKRKPAPAPMVRVCWLDASMTVESHWSDGTKPRRPRARDHVCVTVGILAHIDADFVQVVQTITDGQHANVVNIPTGMVRGDIEILEAVGKVEHGGAKS